MAIKTKEVEYQDGDTVLEGYMAWDDSISSPRPGVLVAHAWSGRNHFVCKKAERMAELGYVGFALDVYGKGVLGTSVVDKLELMSPFLEDRKMLHKRLLAGVQAACSQEVIDVKQMAAIGYCFGGLSVLDLVRIGTDLKGVISYHGKLVPPEGVDMQEITAKVLVLHGQKDPMVQPEELQAFIQEISQTKADWQVHIYGNACHSFTDPEANDPEMGTVYDETAEKRSWQSTVDFLQEVFG